jgi:hypothetical protein
MAPVMSYQEWLSDETPTPELRNPRLIALLGDCYYDWDGANAPRLRRFPENNKDRGMYLEKPQIVQAADVLPDFERDMMTFALSTGLRKKKET